jgi:hypothetical protein
MIKIPVEYDRDTSSAEFTDISYQLRGSPLDVCAATIELRWGHTIDQKVAAVHGTLCNTASLNSNQYLRATCFAYDNSM